MKVIEALKKIKHIDRKIEKANQRIQRWCSYIEGPGEDNSVPTYSREDLRKEVQRIGDLVTQKANIRSALHRTNIETTLEFNGKLCTIDELLVIQNIVIPETLRTLKLFRRKEKNHYNKATDGRVVLQYDPKERDKEIEECEKNKEELDELLDNSTYATELIWSWPVE